MSVRRVAVLSVTDQAISSATNLLVVIVAARHMSTHSFGIFAVAMLLYTVLVPAVQATVGQELQLRGGSPAERMSAARSAIVMSLVVAAAAAATLGLVALGSGDARSSLLVLALCLPLLSAQEVIRGAAVVCNVPLRAVASDLTWLAGVVALAVTVEVVDLDVTPATAMAAWGGCGAVAAVVVAGAWWRVPSEGLARYRSWSFVGYRFLVEFAAMRATSQALILSLGVVAGLASVGAYRGATSLLGPLTVGVLSIANFGAPIAARIDRRRWRVLSAWGGSAICLVVALYAGALMLLSDSAGEALLGASWAGAQDLVPPIAAITAATGLNAMLGALLRLLAPRATLSLRLASAALMPPLFAVGYVLAGVQGAAWGLAAATAAQTVLLAWQLTRQMASAALREAAQRSSESTVRSRAAVEPDGTTQ